MKGWLAGIYGVCLGLAIASLSVLPVNAVSVFAQPSAKRSPSVSPRPRYICPVQLEPLTATLLRDLPGYINRIRLRTVRPQPDTMHSAIGTSQPDFTPLPVNSSEDKSNQDQTLQQVFFTVLQRQYTGRRITEFQEYHWVFLTQTSRGWQLALMYSRFGSYPADKKPLSPPRESSRSLTAQAIRTWLRDCQVGAVTPLGSPSDVSSPRKVK